MNSATYPWPASSRPANSARSAAGTSSTASRPASSCSTTPDPRQHRYSTRLPEAAMAVNVRCPNAACGRVIAVPESYLGKKGRCPGCKSSFILAGNETGGEGFEVVDDGEGQAAPTQSPPEPMTPEHVGRFAVRAVVARSAAFTRYRADDPLRERPVILTVLPVADPAQRRRLVQGLRSAELLRHPAIVPVLEVVADDREVVA